MVEDYSRFHRNEAGWNRDLKQMRHELQRITGLLSESELLKSRDTPGDVGTDIQTVTESTRESLHDVVRASCKRVEESLRSLEEYSKLVSVQAAAGFEQLRYRFYSVEQKLFSPGTLRDRIAEATIYFLLTEQTCRNDWKITAEQAVAAGVDVIQLREKSLDDRELLERAHWLRELTADTNCLFIMNDRPDLARLAKADGIHVGQEELSIFDVRQILGPEPLVGVSTHSLTQAQAAVMDGADYVGVGPTFPSSTKEFTDFPGLQFVQQVAAEIEIPWFAIGGIGLSQLPALSEAGGSRVAVCGVLSQSEEIQQTVLLLKKGLSGNKTGV